ncbi:MAG: hypothetical protein ABR592_14405 [Nitriliruptorales bacterium]
MRLAGVALFAALTFLAGVMLNLGGSDSELPLPAVIELQGEPPHDTPAPLAAPIAPPALPPPPLPVPPALKPPVTAGDLEVRRQAIVGRRSGQAPLVPSPLPAGGEVVDIPRYVSFSFTDDYEYGCEEDEVWDPGEKDCEKVDEAEPDHRDQREADKDDEQD